MGIRELLLRLEKAGFPTNRARIYQAMEAGNLPIPPRDMGHRYLFRESDFVAAKAYLKNPPKRGNPGNRSESLATV